MVNFMHLWISAGISEKSMPNKVSTVTENIELTDNIGMITCGNSGIIKP